MGVETDGEGRGRWGRCGRRTCGRLISDIVFILFYFWVKGDGRRTLVNSV